MAQAESVAGARGFAAPIFSLGPPFHPTTAGPWHSRGKVRPWGKAIAAQAAGEPSRPHHISTARATIQPTAWRALQAGSTSPGPRRRQPVSLNDLGGQGHRSAMKVPANERHRPGRASARSHGGRRGRATDRAGHAGAARRRPDRSAGRRRPGPGRPGAGTGRAAPTRTGRRQRSKSPTWDVRRRRIRRHHREPAARRHPRLPSATSQSSRTAPPTVQGHDGHAVKSTTARSTGQIAARWLAAPSGNCWKPASN